MSESSADDDTGGGIGPLLDPPAPQVTSASSPNKDNDNESQGGMDEFAVNISADAGLVDSASQAPVPVSSTANNGQNLLDGNIDELLQEIVTPPSQPGPNASSQAAPGSQPTPTSVTLHCKEKDAKKSPLDADVRWLDSGEAALAPHHLKDFRKAILTSSNLETSIQKFLNKRARGPFFSPFQWLFGPGDAHFSEKPVQNLHIYLAGGPLNIPECRLSNAKLKKRTGKVLIWISSVPLKDVGSSVLTIAGVVLLTRDSC